MGEVICMRTWKDVKSEIDAELDRIILNEPEEVKKLRLGIIESGAGTRGQYYTTYVFAFNDLRNYGSLGLRPLFKAAADPSFSFDNLKTLFRHSTVLAIFLGYCGFKKVLAFRKDILEVIDTMESKEDFEEFIASYLRYVSRLQLWCHWYFPWATGVALMPQKTLEELREMLKLFGK